jgi:NitT/TauT family transport system ATP-binding protein
MNKSEQSTKSGAAGSQVVKAIEPLIGSISPEPHISLTRVNKDFVSNRGRTVALSDVNLTVGRGSFVSLCGPSGCGKSTILSLVGGLTEPTSGDVTIDGRRVVGPPQTIGTVFQDANLLPWRTVLSNIMYPIELRGGSQKEYRPQAEALLDLVNLRRFANHYPHELSGGMRQRVAICRALIVNPDILLMDEPFSALDALTRDEMSVELHRLWSKYEKTVLFVTHSIREAVYLSDRVVVMGIAPGRIYREFSIDLGHPREAAIETLPRFNELIHEVREAIAEGHAGVDVDMPPGALSKHGR